MGTDALSKEPIQVERKSAKRERRTSNILKLRIQYRGRCPRDPEFVLPNWYREFETADKTTLEQLATIILQILGWSEDHLYEFKIQDCLYVNFGNEDDDYVVDAKEACVSCAIPLDLLDLNIGDPFEFTFDFGELHTFRLTVVAIYPLTLNHSSIPRVLSYMGKNILQYPWLLSRHAACAARRRQPTVDHSGRPKDRWRIRFVRQEDKRQLVEWRESNDKRLWQKAVTVLDNRSLIPEGIAKKLELPVDAIRDWITTYNHKGLAGLNPPRKKDRPGKKEPLLNGRERGFSPSSTAGLKLSESTAPVGINLLWRPRTSNAMERRFQKALSVASSGKLATRSKKHVECFPALIPSIEKRSIWFWVLFEIFNQTSFSSSLMNWAR
jgi:Plasmid pRiA4b ORF-3-like protein